MNDTPLWFRQKTACTTGYVVAGLVALMALCLSVGQGRATKFFLYSLASASCVGAKVLKKASDEAGYILEDNFTTTSLNRQRNLLAPAPKQLKEPAPKFVPKLFDWEDLKDMNAYPAVFISAKQGAGKTTCAEFLGCLIGTGKRYAVSPHLKPSDFLGFDGRYGGGANYFREGDYEPSWSQVAENPDTQWTIHQTLSAIKGLVTGRLREYALGITDFEAVDIYLDETVAISRYFKRECTDKTQKRFLEDFLAMCLTEPRKVKVRFFILTQAETVEALGLSGMAALKDDSCFIRLNHNSMAHAKRLVKQRYLSRDSLDWLLKQNKPVMVDDCLAQLPTIWEMRSLIEDTATVDEDGTTPAEPETLTPPTLQPTSGTVDQPCQQDGTAPAQPETLTESGLPGLPAQTTETDTPKTPLLTPISEDSGTVGTVGTAAQTPETYTTKDLARLARLLNGRTVAELRADTLATLAGTKPDGKAWSKTSILSEYWELGKGGTGQSFGRSLWTWLKMDT